MQRGGSPVTIRDLLDAGLLKPGQELRFSGHEDIRANVTSSGTVRFRGVEYRSPSMAAKAVRGTSLNGWFVWRAKSAGQWIRLRDLRKQLQD